MYPLVCLLNAIYDVIVPFEVTRYGNTKEFGAIDDGKGFAMYYKWRKTVSICPENKSML